MGSALEFDDLCSDLLSNRPQRAAELFLMPILEPVVLQL
jgi:hypothetical protein